MPQGSKRAKKVAEIALIFIKHCLDLVNQSIFLSVCATMLFIG